MSNSDSKPGVDAMTGTFDFVKNFWGSMNIPGIVVPTLSIDEINKQITDLKAVESWLSLNMNMLRSTIQALEVQSATIAALQSMGESLNSAVKSNAAATNSATEASSTPPADEKTGSNTNTANTAPPPFGNPAAWWNMLQEQFQQAVNTATATTSPPASEPPPAPPKSRRKPPKE